MFCVSDHCGHNQASQGQQCFKFDLLVFLSLSFLRSMEKGVLVSVDSTFTVVRKCIDIFVELSWASFFHSLCFIIIDLPTNATRIHNEVHIIEMLF